MRSAVASTLSAASAPAPGLRDRLLAKQVAGSRYVLHELAPPRRVPWTLALAGREQCARDYLVDRASYPFHVIELVEGGRGWVTFGSGREQPIRAGAVFACAPDRRVVLRTDPLAPLTKFFFAVAGTQVERRLADADLPPGAVRRLNGSAGLMSVAEDVIREGQRQSPRAKAICVALLDVLLLKIADAAHDVPAKDERALENFQRCKAVIEQRAEALRSLEEVASAVQLNASSICRLFRRFQGTSPYQYLLRRKMMIAAEHLVDSGGPVSAAAERVGFADPFHFARCFKAVHGVPPSAMRHYRTRSRDRAATGAAGLIA